MRGAAVVRLGVGGDAGLAAQARQQRHLARQLATQRVQGGDAQPRRLLQQAPLALALALVLQHLKPELVGALAVRLGGRMAQGGQLEAAHDAFAHLRRRLVGEGQGDDLLGFLDVLQQRQEALRQQLGFAGPGRGLDDEAAAGVDGQFAVGRVQLQQSGVVCGSGISGCARA